MTVIELWRQRRGDRMTATGPAPDPVAALPWLPPGYTAVLAGRGEVFYRHHRHPDPAAPTLLLLHGWTASADLQFFGAYEALAASYSFIAIDHRGHGRGMRSSQPFTLDDAAADAAALVSRLGVGPVVLVGYSMGGPLALLMARDHPHVARGLVVQATALEWNGTLAERLRWKTVRVISPLLRSWAYPRWVRLAMRKLLGEDHPNAVYAGWLAEELHRNDAFAMVQAGQALSRFDASSWAARLNLPSASLVTTRDRLVKPRKQRALAAALHAQVEEVAGDHLSALMNPVEYTAATLKLLTYVLA